MKTKVFVAFLFCISLLCAGLNSNIASASSGWDRVNSDTSVTIGPNVFVRTDYYTTKSSGGDFAIKFNKPAQNIHGEIKVQLWEFDPNNGDDYVGTRTISGSGGWAIFRGIGKYVDGSNKRAEFYIKVKGNGDRPDWVAVTFYD
ncbi:hypothetical protein [Bacillus cabrialesii]|uniref:hypothetical protein n=1 Tax=Bacillus cabrialesii TaxID=2487276 RepID=UPI0028FA9688|nr:hypothetical protein [Bacillus cabrialesii]MDU0155840.1 hypothetical protein [Bacillus cabrialesii]